MAKWPSYDKGDYDAICDSCGFKYKASELKLRWDGLMVCNKDWEPRQPQDFVRAKIDIQAVVWSRPEAYDTFLVYTRTGTQYTVTSPTNQTDYLFAVNDSGNLFVAIEQNSSTAYHSTDGATWTSTTLPSSGSWTTVSFDGTKFTVTDTTTAPNTSYTSTDGITWL